MQGHKSKKLERNAEIYPVLSLYKESRSKRCIIKFSSYDRALTNSWLCKRKLSFTEHFQWLVAYINQVDLKKKLKDGGRPSSREYLLPLKDSENVIVCRSMFLNTLGLKSNGMIIKMVRAQRQSYDGAIAPGQDWRGRHPPSNTCDAEVIPLHINSYKPLINHYKRKNSPCKWYINPKL